MAARNFADVPYLPMLAVSVAEMRALEELPNKTKDRLLPYFQIRPWGVRHDLKSTMNRIEKAYGNRPYLADLCGPITVVGDERPVHREIVALRQSAGGYGAWCGLIENNPQMIPVVQLGDLTQLTAQVARLYGLGRGLALYFPVQALPRISDITRLLAPVTNDGVDVVVIIDLGQRHRDILLAQAATVGLVREVRRALPNAAAAVSASSFPSDFVGLASQDIFERAHFQGVVAQLPGEPIIYSDRGSARAEKQMGGGGQPAPRVDLAKSEEWRFHRDGGDGARIDAYIRQARLAMAPPHWDGRLRVWGHQMIERTAGGDKNAIKSPSASTAARINIHLHRQAFWGDPVGMYETDEEWED